MERDYDFSSALHASDLDAPENDRQDRRRARGPTAQSAQGDDPQSVPVIFDPRVAGSLIGHLASAINGASVARKTSFLKDKMGEQIFATRHPHHRRSAAAARPALASLRRRRRRRRKHGLGRGRRSQDHGSSTARPRASSGLTTTGHARAACRRRPRRRRPICISSRARSRPSELISGNRRRLLRHRPDRHGHQYRHRRLQPRRCRLLDRERRT